MEKGGVTNIKDRKCDKCGKNFIPAPYHLYRLEKKGKWYCGRHCFEHRNDKPTDGKYEEQKA